ncbi:MAG: DUF1475 family protein [Pseudomonadota bacterium]
MIKLKIISVMGICLMLAALIYGFTHGDLSSEGSKLISMPWGQITLIDFYIGVLFFSSWVWFREKNNLISLGWTIAFIFTGNLATAIYLFKAVYESGGSSHRLLLGNQQQ